MSKLFRLNLELLEQNQSLLVPSIFTKKQLELLQKKICEREFTPTEKAYFSRTVTKKLAAINILSTGEITIFANGEKFMLKERKEEAIKLLKSLERKHKNIKILIGGSFLYSKEYNDVDIFLISKYEKEEHKQDRLHFNYLKPEALGSLFFNSLSKISITNFNLNFILPKENIKLEHIISKYQEIMQELSNKAWLKIDLRDFIMACHYVSSGTIINSMQLRNILKKMLNIKNKEKIIQKLFVNTILMGFNSREIKKMSIKMIKSYRELEIEYKHKEYYRKLINSFKEVLNCAS